MLTARRRWVAALDDDAAADAADAAQPSAAASAASRARRRRRRARRASVGFASMSMGGVVAASSGEEARRPNPVATLAGLFGKKATPPPPPFPKWREVAGHLAAGATAGAAVEAALYPIDTIKTRLQLAAKGGGLRALVAGGGGRGLYAGVWGNLAGVAPASAIFMGCYEPVKARVAAANPDKPWLGPLVAGAAAGAAASVVRVPTEVVKQRVQAGHFVRGAAALKTILATEGVAGLFAGYGSFLLRDLPFDAIEFVAYEQLKRFYSQSVGGRELRAPEVSAVGAAAGAVTGVVTTPLDVLKTRLMTQGASGKYKGVIDCARRVAAEEGVGTLFAGWQPRVLWIGLGGCVFFSALEAAKKAYAADPAEWAKRGAKA